MTEIDNIVDALFSELKGMEDEAIQAKGTLNKFTEGLMQYAGILYAYKSA